MKKEITIYHVDAFTSKKFSGNPAAVCVMNKWPEDHIMQAIANKNNVSETAFIAEREGKYIIRWMTPTQEVNLCGHATMAASYVIFNHLNYENDEIIFNSLSGELKVEQENDLISMDFPSYMIYETEVTEAILQAFSKDPIEVLVKDEILIVVFDSENYVRNYTPNYSYLASLIYDDITITSRSNSVDFILRVFAPNQGIPEDPVTGSAQSLLTPFWSRELGKKKLHSHQVSPRGGELFTEDLGNRVKISGGVTFQSINKITLDI